MAAPARAPARRSAPAPRPNHLRVVRSARRPSGARRRRLAVTIALAISLVAVFGLVGLNAFLVQSQFRLERLEGELNAEREEFEQLRLETARLSSPERILEIARVELGMSDPEAVTHLSAPTRGDAPEAGPGGTAWAEVKPYLAAEP